MFKTTSLIHYSLLLEQARFDFESDQLDHFSKQTGTVHSLHPDLCNVFESQNDVMKCSICYVVQIGSGVEIEDM